MSLFFRSNTVKQKGIAGLLLAFLLAGTGLGQQAAQVAAVESEIAEKITIASIKENAGALAADEMQGRGTLQAGGDKAAAWIADRFQKYGLKPLGDKGSYFQKVDFKEVIALLDTSFNAGDQTLVSGTDFAFVPMNNGNKDVTGEMVFVGFGIQSRALKRDDLAGVNIQGKVIVMLKGPPAYISKESWEKADASIAITRSLIFAGAAAIVYIGNGREENSPEQTINYIARRQIITPDEKGYPEQVPPMLYVSRSGAEKLFAKSGTTVADALKAAEPENFKPINLNVKAKLRARYKMTPGASSNVVGYLEGSDPALKQEAVLFSAHYDAYGTENGKIYRGAADNALGTAEMLAVAEAFSKLTQKPKRSMIFLAVTGEEYGLYGSKYWADKPTWDIKKVAANLNLDGIGTEVYGSVKTMVGYGAEYSTLGQMLTDVASAKGINVIPDPMPEEKVFERSDHYSFVQRGVPALMLLGAPAGEKEKWMQRIKDWEKTDYHQPADMIMPTWAWDGPESVAEIMAVMGWRISESPAMPSWLGASRFGKLERGNKKELPAEK